MSQVNVDAEQVRIFSDSLRTYVNSTSEVMMRMRNVYDHLDSEWDDSSKVEFIDSFRKTCTVIKNVNEALSGTTSDLTELASIIEQYANV